MSKQNNTNAPTLVANINDYQRRPEQPQLPLMPQPDPRDNYVQMPLMGGAFRTDKEHQYVEDNGNVITVMHSAYDTKNLKKLKESLDVIVATGVDPKNNKPIDNWVRTLYRFLTGKLTSTEKANMDSSHFRRVRRMALSNPEIVAANLTVTASRADLVRRVICNHWLHESRKDLRALHPTFHDAVSWASKASSDTLTAFKERGEGKTTKAAKATKTEKKEKKEKTRKLNNDEAVALSQQWNPDGPVEEKTQIYNRLKALVSADVLNGVTKGWEPPVEEPPVAPVEPEVPSNVVSLSENTRLLTSILEAQRHLCWHIKKSNDLTAETNELLRKLNSCWNNDS